MTLHSEGRPDVAGAVLMHDTWHGRTVERILVCGGGGFQLEGGGGIWPPG